MASSLAYELRSKYRYHAESLRNEEFTIRNLQSSIEMYSLFLRIIKANPDRSFFSLLLDPRLLAKNETEFSMPNNDSLLFDVFSAIFQVKSQIKWFEGFLANAGFQDRDRQNFSINELVSKVELLILDVEHKLSKHKEIESHHKEVISEIFASGLCPKCKGRGSWYNSALAEGDPYARSSDCQEPCEPCGRTGLVSPTTQT